MDFKEWSKYNLGYTGEDAYKAGQQSKQAEIDELQKRINEALELINNQHDTSTIKFVRYAINKTLKGE